MNITEKFIKGAANIKEHDLIKVYVKTDEKGNIIDINSSIFIFDTKDWIEIGEGQGDKYAHAQCNYFDKGLVLTNGIYRYRLKEGAPYEKTESEIQTETAALPTESTAEEDLISMTIDHEYRLTLLELGV